jgi:WD40 repeat protein
MNVFKTVLVAVVVIVLFQTSSLSAQPQDDTVFGASYAPDGSLIAIVGTVQDFSGLFIFDTTGREQSRVEMRGANGVAWGPDGRLAVRWVPEGETEYFISILDAKTREETVRFDALFPVDAPELHWSPDGHMLLHYRQSTYSIWDTTEGNLLSSNVLGYTGRDTIQDAFWHPLTQEIYILDTSNRIFVFDPVTGKQTHEPLVLEIQPGGTEGYYLYASQIEITSDGSQIAVAFNDRRQTMQVINTDTGETIRLFNAPAPDYDIRELRWSVDGQAIATLGTSISIWDIESGELQQILTGFGIPYIRTFAFRLDGNQVVIVGTDTSATVGKGHTEETTELTTIVLMPATAVLMNLNSLSLRGPN